MTCDEEHKILTRSRLDDAALTACVGYVAARAPRRSSARTATAAEILSVSGIITVVLTVNEWKDLSSGKRRTRK